MTPSALSNEARNTRDEIVTRILDLTVVGKVLSDMTDVETDIFCDELRSIVTNALITELLSYRREGAVKLLEWVDNGDAWNARGYRIERDGHRFYVRSNEASGLFGTIEFADTLEAAKAAAQLDYATRIKSALSPSTETIEGWQPIETAVRSPNPMELRMVEKSGYTPGPWAVEINPFGSAIAKDGCCIATAHGQAAITRAELPHEANARLIAAAPELLAALTYARNLIGPDEILDQALSKALGEPHA